MPHNITEAKNTSVGLSRYLLSKTKVSTPPHPYTDQAWERRYSPDEDCRMPYLNARSGVSKMVPLKDKCLSPSLLPQVAPALSPLRLVALHHPPGRYGIHCSI